jgi:hypothetical protein
LCVFNDLFQLQNGMIEWFWKVNHNSKLCQYALILGAGRSK